MSRSQLEKALGTKYDTIFIFKIIAEKVTTVRNSSQVHITVMIKQKVFLLYPLKAKMNIIIREVTKNVPREGVRINQVGVQRMFIKNDHKAKDKSHLKTHTESVHENKIATPAISAITKQKTKVI